MLSRRIMNESIISDLDEARELLGYKENEIKNFTFFNDIKFNDDIWDFSQLNKNNRACSTYKFNFEKIRVEYKNYVKIVSLENLLYSHNRIQTISKDIEIMRTIVNDFTNKGIVTPEIVTYSNIKEVIEEKNRKVKDGYLGRYLGTLIKLIKLIYSVNKKKDFEILNYLKEKMTECNKCKYKESYNEYIPDEFFDKIVSLAIKDSLREDISATERIFGCLMVILAETGMRLEELCLLETNKLEEIEIENKRVSYLNFITIKSAKTIEEKIDTYCYVSDLAVAAYKRAENLVYNLISNMSEKIRKKVYLDLIEKNQLDISDSENLTKEEEFFLEGLAKRYIFISDVTRKKIMHTGTLREYLNRFTIRNYNEIMEVANLYGEQVSYFKIENEARFEKFFGRGKNRTIKFDEIKDVKFPYVNFHRFRVTVCTKLYEKGIPVDYIRMHMNHLYEEMTTYYIKSDRKINQLEENIQDLQLIMNEDGYVDEQVNNIDIDVEEINTKIKKINNFLKKNKINVKSDLGIILEIIKKKNGTVVENEFGVCIKSLISGICKKRKYFNRNKDIYGIGVELETFKYIHLNYERFTQKVEIIEHNQKIVEKNEELNFELEREIKSLRYFLEKTLIREIELLKNEIENIGKENFIEKYRDLSKIVENIEGIEGEVMGWI